MKKFGFALFVSTLGLLPTAANAATLNFDDLGSFASVPNGYGGMNFYNFTTMDPVGSGGQLANSGYAAGVVSPKNVIFNSFADPAAFYSPSKFLLKSLYLTAAWRDGLIVYVSGMVNGAEVWNQILAPSSTAPTFYSFNKSSVDAVVFTSFGGVQHAGYDGDGAHFAIDDVTFASANGVPEPAAWAMMLAGFGLVGAAMRRREKVAVTYA